MEQPINRVLHERYRIQSLLGRQTGRRTFLAEDLQTHSLVVVKLLLFGQDFTWDDLKLFQREAETLKLLEHPSIPKPIDTFEVELESGKGLALVQDYIEARSLQDWIQSGRTFSEEELKAIARELLEILIYLHNCQPPVVHRDIKPSNILLGDRTGNSPGKVYLIDFGSVQTVASPGTLTVVGTYGYMPPEQFGGRATPRSDLYSLGATIIYLATGQHPAALLTEDLRLELPKSARLSPQLTYWLRQMTTSSPSQRFASAVAALEALNNPQFGTTNSGFSGLNASAEFSLLPRPDNAKCKLNKNTKSIEIIDIPIPFNEKMAFLGSRLVSFPAIATFLLIIFDFVMSSIYELLSAYFTLKGVSWSPMNLLVYTVGYTLILLFFRKRIYWWFKRTNTDSSTVIKIDNNQILTGEKYVDNSDVALWFAKADQSNIQKLILICKGESCRVEIAVSSSKERKFLIGNGWSVNERKFLLPKKEAEWLVSELSLWLQMPVTKGRVEEQWTSDVNGNSF